MNESNGEIGRGGPDIRVTSGTILGIVFAFLSIVPAFSGCTDSEDGPGDGGGGTGGGQPLGGHGGEGDGGMGGKAGSQAGTPCAPPAVCVGEETGCTQCPTSGTCVVDIVSGSFQQLGGSANDEGIEVLNHRCEPIPEGCTVEDPNCDESLCREGVVLDQLPSQYDDLGNLSLVSEGAIVCELFDG